MSARVFLLEGTAWDPGSSQNVNVRLSSHPHHVDFNGENYEPYLKGGLNRSVRIFNPATLEVLPSALPQLGTVTILLGDRRQMPLASYEWIGHTVTVRRGVADRQGNLAYGDFQLVQTARVRDFTATRAELILALGDLTEALDVPLQTATYAGTGEAEGGTDLKGEVKPDPWGRPRNIEGKWVDRALLIIQLASGRIQNVLVGRDKGVDITYSGQDEASFAALKALANAASIPPGQFARALTATGSYVALGATPAGTVTWDVEGDDSGSGFVETTADVIRRMITDRTTLTDSDLDLPSFTAFNAAQGAAIDFYASTPITVANAVAQLLRPVRGYLTVTRAGKLRIVRFGLGTSVETITQDRMKDLRRVNTGVPLWRVKCAYGVAWRQQSRDELAIVDGPDEHDIRRSARTSVSFPGSTPQSVEIVNNSIFDRTVGEAWSLEFEVKINSLVADSTASVISKMDVGASPDTGWEILAREADRKFALRLGNGTTFNQILHSESLIVLGRWHKIAVSCSAGGVWKFYVDEVLGSAGLTDQGNFNNAEPVRIGISPAGLLPLDGAVQDVRFWSTERTAAQFVALRHEDLTGGETGLLALYRFDEGTGLTAADSGPSGLDATLSGNAGWGGPTGSGRADVTADNTSADTTLVDGVAAATIHDGADRALGAIKTDERTLKIGVVIDPGDGNSRQLTRGLLSGMARDGDAITFSPAWPNEDLPVVKFNPGGLLTSASLSGDLWHNFQALDISPSGFTASLRLSEKTGTPTSVTETGGTSGHGTGPDWQMNKSDANQAVDDNYTFQFDVSVTNELEAENPPFGWLPGSVVVSIWTNGGSGWVQRGTKGVSGGTGGATTARLNETKTVTVSGLTTHGGNEFGIDVESAFPGGSITAFDSVKYDKATAPSTVDATPSTVTAINWELKGGE
ncbi:MAG: LamG domain-containing protein [Sphingomonadales bacterium]|nr:LamG domain-containing protein [Sphingomonadales bacterium]